MHETTEKERALLVLVLEPGERWPQPALAQEFKHLVASCGIEVIDLITLKLRKPTSALYLGSGKAEELAGIVEAKQAPAVIFNNNLSSRQQRNLEDLLKVKTIDRTQLILDVFAQRANTSEGSLQVELAQLKYLLPRLKGKGIMLSRLGGGIGTRGPGEKKLEIDRRRIEEKLDRLKDEIEQVRGQRQLNRKKRQKEQLKVCSLVGYTSAGKSTLFNALTASLQPTAKSLFTTLDTVSHQLVLKNNVKALLTDTVGFIYKLPPGLIQAFRATLEELEHADVLLHVIDPSHPEASFMIASVDQVLKDLGLQDKPRLLLFNKIDLLNDEVVIKYRQMFPQALFICALNGSGLASLKETIYAQLFGQRREVLIRLQFNQMNLTEYIHNNCEVLKNAYQHDQVLFWVRAEQNIFDYLVKLGITLEEIS